MPWPTLIFSGSTPKLDRRRHPNGLAVLEPLSINGTQQWVLMRSQDIRNPVVLFVHGGPGASMLGVSRHDTRALEKHFTVVHWDQRGAGKSYAAGSDTARIADYVDDLIVLATLLRARFRQQKIVLVGHSWGSAIGMLAVAARPELFAAYVGIGQMSSSARSEALSYQWTLEQARARGNRKAVAALLEIGPPPYTGDWRPKMMRQRSLLARFGGEVHRGRSGALGVLLRNVCSREYTMRDRVNYLRGVLRSATAVGPELSKLDLFAQVPRVEVPVYFCLGRHDQEVPSALSAAYFEALQAPFKQLVWFDESAHMPNTEQRDEWNRFMIKTVLPALARDRAEQAAMLTS